jgi:hypothetical protein
MAMSIMSVLGKFELHGFSLWFDWMCSWLNMWIIGKARKILKLFPLLKLECV